MAWDVGTLFDDDDVQWCSQTQQDTTQGYLSIIGTYVHKICFVSERSQKDITNI